MLVLVLPVLLLVIIGFIIAYTYLIFRPEPLASIAEKAKVKAGQRSRPLPARRVRPRL